MLSCIWDTSSYIHRGTSCIDWITILHCKPLSTFQAKIINLITAWFAFCIKNYSDNIKVPLSYQYILFTNPQIGHINVSSIASERVISLKKCSTELYTRNIHFTTGITQTITASPMNFTYGSWIAMHYHSSAWVFSTSLPKPRDNKMIPSSQVKWPLWIFIN